jgi:hypothetical protein
MATFCRRQHWGRRHRGGQHWGRYCKGDLGAGNLGAGNLGAGNLGAGDLGAGDLGAGDIGAGNKLPLYRKFTKWSQNIPTCSVARPSKIYPNWEFWFGNQLSGNPVLELSSSDFKITVKN